MSRESARATLRSGLLESIELKQAEARRLTKQLRASLLEEAFTPRQTRKPERGVCRGCGARLLTGELVVEYVDDDGRVVDVFHVGHRPD